MPKFFKKFAKNIASIPGGSHNLAGNEELGITGDYRRIIAARVPNTMIANKIAQATNRLRATRFS